MSDWLSVLEQSLPAPAQGDWADALRAQGAAQLQRHGLPGKHVEQWKYTPLAALHQQQPGLAVANQTAHPETSTPEIALEPMIDGPRAQLHNGQLRSVDGSLPAGVRVLALNQALLEDEVAADHSEVRELLQSLDLEQRWHSLSALNTATLGAGLVISVDAGVDAGTLLLQWTGNEASPAALFNTRVCVLLGANARLDLVEHYADDGGQAPLLNGVQQVQLAEAAQLSHTRVQQQAAGAMLILRTDVNQAADSRYQFTGIDLGSGLARHDVRAALQGQGATCALNGACISTAQSHVDHHFEADHQIGNCSSEQLFRAVAYDRSKVVFNGKVHMAKGADGSESQQSCAGLLQSPLAEIDCKPELEIYAEEVIASHGATVGQLDEQAEFYMRSRGLDQDQARRLLTIAFCRSVADRLPLEALREPLGERMAARMQAHTESKKTAD